MLTVSMEPVLRAVQILHFVLCTNIMLCVSSIVKVYICIQQLQKYKQGFSETFLMPYRMHFNTSLNVIHGMKVWWETTSDNVV